MKIWSVVYLTTTENILFEKYSHNDLKIAKIYCFLYENLDKNTFINQSDGKDLFYSNFFIDCNRSIFFFKECMPA